MPPEGGGWGLGGWEVFHGEAPVAPSVKHQNERRAGGAHTCGAERPAIRANAGVSAPVEFAVVSQGEGWGLGGWEVLQSVSVQMPAKDRPAGDKEVITCYFAFLSRCV